MVAVTHRAGAQRGRVRSGARLGQAVARQQFHGAKLGSHFWRCVSLPKASIIHADMLWIEMNADTVGQPCASASKINAASNRVSAEPPTSSRI